MKKQRGLALSERSESKGFTLIELLVVIAITAVLLAIGLPNYLGARERSRDAKVKLELNQFKQALRMYYNDYQKYPAHSVTGVMKGCGPLGDLNCPQTTVAACTGLEFAAGGANGCSNVYMKRLPKPSGGSGEIKYNQTNSGEGFSVCIGSLENLSDAEGAASRVVCPLTVSVGSKNTYCVCSD